MTRSTTLVALTLVVVASFAGFRWLRYEPTSANRSHAPGPLQGSGASPPTSPNASRGATLFGRCGACHPIDRTSVDRDGPNLFGVVGAPVAARRPRFAYTAALRRFGGVWTVDRLDAWLARPAALVPGTTMRFDGVADPQDRADIIAYLGSQSAAAASP